MPQLHNDRYESFALAMANGYSQTEAAKRANFPETSAHNTGSRLMRRPDVRQRVEELKVTIDPKQIASRDWVICEAIENHRLARKAEDIPASTSCLQFIAKLQGYLVERRETYGERTNIYELRAPEVARLMGNSLKQLPEAQRLQILEAEPAVAELLESAALDCQPSACVSENNDIAGNVANDEANTSR